jgi:hypothetical protein
MSKKRRREEVVDVQIQNSAASHAYFPKKKVSKSFYC